ncbi:MAG: hypothetical protein M1831_006479 [Alyxoria varia]|nr:MAG: hypothetical protein M1831_006479 [Alyxoria varia]
MSEPGRKNISDKFSESVTPDSSKSTAQKAKEGITDTGDKVAREGTTNESKSAPQKLADSAGSTKDEQKSGGTGGSMVDSLKKTVGMDK